MEELKILISCGDTSILLSRYVDIDTGDNTIMSDLLKHLEKEVNWFLLMKENDDVTNRI